MELVAVFSVCFLMNFLGVYATTEASPATSVQTAETTVKKTRIAQAGNLEHGSLMEALMAHNEQK